MLYLFHAVWCIVAQSRLSIGSCAIQTKFGAKEARCIGLAPNREGYMSMNDQTLYCRDCNQEFTFTVGEQEFYASRGLTNAPSRCPECRAARKQSGGSGYSDRGRSSYGDRSDRQMYSATCANCGKEALVPFQPREDRPVYCSDCYQSQGSGRGNSNRRSRW